MTKVVNFPSERCRPSKAQLEHDRIMTEKWLAQIDNCYEILAVAIAQMRQGDADDDAIRGLLANVGVNDELRCAFLVYVISHNRPMAEVRALTLKPLGDEFERGFAGMTQEPVALADLEATRKAIRRHA
jgi:hypothetical protein